MRSFFIISLVTALSLQLKAQDDSKVINNAGFTLSGTDFSTTLSIGEPAVSTLVSPDSKITQGFLQPFEIKPCTSVAFEYYPNPARDEMHIRAVGCDNQMESVQILDLWGRLITTVGLKDSDLVFLGDLAPGLYIFKVTLSGGVSGTFNVIKVSK